MGAAHAADSSTDSSTTSNGVTRTPLSARRRRTNAPGQVLYLQRVTIAPGAKLVEHFQPGHAGGALSWPGCSPTTIRFGQRDGHAHETARPRCSLLPRRSSCGPAASLVETQGLVHHGENGTKHPVVIELAALLAEGAPLATPVGEGATGTALHVTARPLDSLSRTLTTVGATGAQVYGWNQLAGTDPASGVSVAMLASVNYENGSGPFFGFVTFTFPDGSTLGVQMQGNTRSRRLTARRPRSRPRSG